MLSKRSSVTIKHAPHGKYAEIRILTVTKNERQTKDKNHHCISLLRIRIAYSIKPQKKKRAASNYVFKEIISSNQAARSLDKNAMISDTSVHNESLLLPNKS